MSIPITNGSGQSSVAAEAVAGLQYQQIQVLGGGGSSILSITPDGSAKVSIVGTVQVTGSVVTVGNGSVSGTVGASVIGWVPIQPSNTSVITVAQSSSIIAVVTGSVVAIPTGNQSISGAVFVSGSVLSQQTGTVITSVVSTVPSSVLVGASIFGQLPAGTAALGSVAALQGTNPWVTTPTGNQSVSGALFVSGSVLLGSSNASVIATLQSSSIIAINAGSVVTIPVGSTLGYWDKSPSIVGTYAEDAAFTQNDKGLFVLGVRNDNMASVTSADLDYSQWAVGPIGENIVANAPITKWVQGSADLRGLGSTGVSVVAIASGGSSVFTYITGVQVSNMGSASVLVTLASGGSILGYTIAPAGGGSNITYRNALKTPANFGFAASISGVASVLVSAQGFVSRT